MTIHTTVSRTIFNSNANSANKETELYLLQSVQKRRAIDSISTQNKHIVS
jgi:hypothetical protein